MSKFSWNDRCYLGSCHVVVHSGLIPYLFNKTLVYQVTLFDDDLYVVHLFTDKLPAGYHGEMNFILTDDFDYRLKPERDV